MILCAQILEFLDRLVVRRRLKQRRAQEEESRFSTSKTGKCLFAAFEGTITPPRKKQRANVFRKIPTSQYVIK